MHRLRSTQLASHHPLGSAAFCCAVLALAISLSSCERAPSQSAIERGTLSELTRKVELHPKSAKHRAARAKWYFTAGQYDLAIADLEQAIQLNPADRGREQESGADAPLPSDALRNGEEQLRRMLADRPAMASAVEPGDELWSWTARKFAGEDSGIPIIWDNRSPEPDVSDFGIDAGRAWIQVTDDVGYDVPTQACTALWAILVRRLYQLGELNAESALSYHVATGQITKEDYKYEKMARSEHAIQRARGFYLRLFAPLQLSKGVERLWPEEWHCFRFFADKSSRDAVWEADPEWSRLGDSYDLIWAASPRSRCGKEEALGLLHQLKVKESEFSVGFRGELHYWSAVFHFRHGDEKLSFAEIAAAEKLWPESQQIKETREYFLHGEYDHRRAETRN